MSVGIATEVKASSTIGGTGVPKLCFSLVVDVPIGEGTAPPAFKSDAYVGYDAATAGGGDLVPDRVSLPYLTVKSTISAYCWEVPWVYVGIAEWACEPGTWSTILSEAMVTEGDKMAIGAEAIYK